MVWQGCGQLQRAEVGDVDDVVEVLDEVATWMSGRGIVQWPPRFVADWVRPAVEAGETWLAVVDNRLAATITLSWEDPVWDLEESAAGYVHRIAVRRCAAGLGAPLLDWAQNEALRRGRPLLRLDCVADNERLRAYYQGAGFLHRGDVEVRGAPGLRDQAGPPTLVSRYERASPTIAPRQDDGRSPGDSSRRPGGSRIRLAMDLVGLPNARLVHVTSREHEGIALDNDDVITHDTPGIVEGAAGDTFDRGTKAHHP